MYLIILHYVETIFIGFDHVAFLAVVNSEPRNRENLLNNQVIIMIIRIITIIRAVN